MNTIRYIDTNECKIRTLNFRLSKPKIYKKVIFKKELTTRQYNNLISGRYYNSVDSNWLIIFLDNWLYFFSRGYTNYIYWLEIKTIDNKKNIEEVFLNRDPVEFDFINDNDDIRTINELIEIEDEITTNQKSIAYSKLFFLEPTRSKIINTIKGILFGYILGNNLFKTKRKQNGINESRINNEILYLILETIVENKGIYYKNIASKLFSRLSNTCVKSDCIDYDILRDPNFLISPHKTAKKYWLDNTKQNNNIIALMPIIGIWQYYNFEEVKKNTKAVTKIMNFSPNIIGSCLTLTYLIGLLLKGIDDHNIIDYLLQNSIKDYEPQIKNCLSISNSNNLDFLKDIIFLNMNINLKSLIISLWVYKNVNTLEKGKEILLKSEMLENNTQGAVIGSIIGAKLGYNNLPEIIEKRVNFESTVTLFINELFDERT